MSAAFDTVNHQILLSTLRRMGISGTALLWFESYLSDRSFRVSWRGEVSKSQLLATGVPKFLRGPHVTPLFIRLHWLPIAARIKFKVLMFAYKTTTGAAPIYLNLLVQAYAPSRSLRSASERRLVVPSQRGTKSLSRTFSWTVPSWQWWTKYTDQVLE